MHVLERSEKIDANNKELNRA